MISRENNLDASQQFLIAFMLLSDPELFIKLSIKPNNALSSMEFNQLGFVKHVNSHYQKNVFDPRGMCFGYFIVQFAYSCLGIENELANNLGAINLSQTFNEEQNELINLLKLSQDNLQESEIGVVTNDHPVIISKLMDFKKIDLHNDYHFSEELEKVTDFIINLSIDNFGDMIGLIADSELGFTQISGLMAKRENDQIILEYNDPNYYLQVKYNNADSVRTDLFKFLKFGFSSFHQSAWDKHKTAGFFIHQFTAECNGDYYSTPEKRAWAVQNKHLFFAKKTTVGDERKDYPNNSRLIMN